MFSAKSVIIYGKNPYDVLPLQFAAIDPWISFMRWTHLPSAYSPLWIAITLPVYIFGMGQYLSVLFVMKLLVGFSYLVTVYFIGKILEVVSPDRKWLGMIFYAANPLVITEVLVSAHNDSLMIAAASISVYLLVKKSALSSWMWYSVSIAVKTMTIFALPGMLCAWLKDKHPYYISRVLLFLGMCFGLLLVATQRDILGWYWLWVLLYAAIVPMSSVLAFFAIGSIGLVGYYAPFLYFGVWDSPVPQHVDFIIGLFFVIALIVAAGMELYSRVRYPSRAS